MVTLPARMSILHDTPRQFDNSGQWSYQQGHILDANETGPLDLLSPAREFKLFENACGIDEKLEKFKKEVLKYSCACLNLRTNATLYFGIADEKHANRFGKKPGEIVGVEIEHGDKHKFIDALTEAINNRFDVVGAKECIRPPKFITARPRDNNTEISQAEKYVIEVDIEPKSAHTKSTYFKVTLPGSSKPKLFIRDGANSKEVPQKDLHNFMNRTLPNLIKAREEQENKNKETPTKAPEELTAKLDKQLCLSGNAIDTQFTRILLVSEIDFTSSPLHSHPRLNDLFDVVIYITDTDYNTMSKMAKDLLDKYWNSRIIILCLLTLSNESMKLAHHVFAKTFHSYQMVYYCESEVKFATFRNHLLSKYHSKRNLQEKSVVGINFPLYNEALKQVTEGYSSAKSHVHVPGPNGILIECPKHVYETEDITILDVKKCEQLYDLTPEKFKEQSHAVEESFYKGEPLSWENLWFTDEKESHVIERNCFREIDEKVNKALSLDGKYHKVWSVTVYHRKGTGATTILKQILWKYSKQAPYQCRCCIVKNVTKLTAGYIMKFHTGEENALPVLVLVDDHDEAELEDLISQIREQAQKINNCEKPVVIFLCGHRCCSPKYSADMDQQSSVFIKNGLSQPEYQRFCRKFYDLKVRLDLNSEEFETYADKSLLTFKILLCPDENTTKRYLEQVILQVFKDCLDQRYELIKYLTLLLASHFGHLMIKAKWVCEILDSAGQLFKFTEVSGANGTKSTQLSEKHPMISECVMNYIKNDREMHDPLMSSEILEVIEKICEFPTPSRGGSIMQKEDLLQKFEEWRSTLPPTDPPTTELFEEILNVPEQATDN